MSETPVTFAGAGRASTETVIASARSCSCSCGIETAIAFAGAKWAFWFSFRVQWCCWFQRRHAVAPCALSFWGARVRVVTNVVNPMAFSLKMAVFGLRLTTFVTGVLARRFESRWFDDVCNIGRPLVPRPGPAPRSVPYPQFRMQFPGTCSSSLSEKPGISTITFQSMKCTWGNCMRICADQVPPPPMGGAAWPC